MNEFDAKEQIIYDEISQINVDASKLVKEVKSRIREEISLSDSYHRRWRRSVAAAVAMLAVCVFTAAAAVSGGFDWFMEKFNPSFGEIVEPVGIYSEDKGIRMEIIGAQKYNNMAIVYLSLQDVTGQNRLTEQTDFRDGYSVKMNPQKQETPGQKEIISGSLSWKKEVIYFNEDTNTIYYEFIITADPDTPLADPLELGSFLIYFSKTSYVDEPISLSLENLDTAEVISITEDNVWGGSNLPDNDYGIYTKALKPGYMAAMPHGEEDQWISNVGVIDGKLHVQVGRIMNKEFGSSDVELAVLTSEGEAIQYDYSIDLLEDENNNILNFEENNYSGAAYKYEEFIFPVVPENFNIYFNGFVSSGVEGNWRAVLNLNGSDKNILVWNDNIAVEDYLIEHISLSPLGLQIIGSYEDEELSTHNVSAEVETGNGIIRLEEGGGSRNHEKQTFSIDWSTETPIDVAEVTAVIIDGTRIPVVD
ncbi:hypothetical protein [Sedimentibacter sp.]|uniref:hypothetical protein n=2 Tax=Sedimentibacter sp. TaxID=1960295 RepID=UPI0028A69954|nr:hypothetical protein [Sedimentibacter sp.]